MSDSTAQVSFDDLAASILEDGVIDANEVSALKALLYEDGVIDRQEADFLFRLNDQVSGKENDPGWQTLFVEAITDHVLADDTSPGEVDEEEGDWLISRIEGDGEYDALEKALLSNIKAKATAIHGKLKFKIDMFGE